MAMTEQTRAYFDAHFAPETEQLWANDKEFAERFAEFALNEVVSQNQLDEKTRFLAILATLLGCQGVDAFRVMLPAALKAGGDAGGGQGSGLPGHRLPGHGTGVPLPPGHQ